jgi:hypothetical protein
VRRVRTVQIAPPSRAFQQLDFRCTNRLLEEV